VTTRRFVLGWTGLCAAGWFSVGGLAEGNEADCRANLCFSPGAALLTAGVFAVGIWLVGGLVAWAVTTTRRSRTDGELPVPAESEQREIGEDE
jgi:hypothetical protein